MNTPATTAATLQTYLASIPGLGAPGAVSVNGTPATGFNVNFGPGITGGGQLLAAGNAGINVGDFLSGGTNTFDGIHFNASTGTTSFTYNGSASADDLLTFKQVPGSTNITYNGAAASDDLISFTQGSGTVLLSYDGASAPASFSFTPATTAGQFQSYLATINALATAGTVGVSGVTGGPFNVHFAAGLTGTKLAVVSGPAH